ncbi:MAG: hypothetical protein ACP59X_12185 [Solidesulfovibrio sp. DCME]|uniref:hypothetical protein n=1 Tax=Solidesulfovibrio sp. DCME TaxID=3447380 RepID=UPI003D13861E
MDVWPIIDDFADMEAVMDHFRRKTTEVRLHHHWVQCQHCHRPGDPALATAADYIAAGWRVAPEYPGYRLTCPACYGGKAGVDLRAWIEAGLPPVFTLPSVKKPADCVAVSGTPGPSTSGLLLLRGAGGFLGEVVETAATLALAAFLERYASAGVTLSGCRFAFPEGFPEALRAEAERLYEAVETEWIETEGWKPEKVRACGAASE